MTKKQLINRIQQLDPLKDHLEIVHLNSMFDFPWDNARALEFALFRTFAVQSIGELLHKTQEFEQRTQKRYDDTDLILSEIIENGYESERGKAALIRMNKMHGSHRIANEDMRYVLSTFVMEPYRWNARFGYRKVTENEKIATHRLWFEIGTRMGITEIPDSFEAMEHMNTAYEKARFGYSVGGQKVANATINLMLSWYLPRWLWSTFKPCVIALMDEPLREALQLKRPGIIPRFFLQAGMGVRKIYKRIKPLRRKAFIRTNRTTRSYPNGYRIEELGVKSNVS